MLALAVGVLSFVAPPIARQIGPNSAPAMRRPAVVMQSFADRVKSINEGNKMKAVKRNQKPKASPKRLPPA